MLFADKRALETDLKLGLLEIREKELNFYATNCGHLAFLASIFAGFASAALMTHVPKEPVVLHFLYLLVTVVSLGLHLCALVSTTLLAMIGPGLALRGPDGSMHVAIDAMIGEYRTAFFQLLLGLLALHGSVASFCWLVLNPVESAALTACIVGALAFEVRYIKVVFSRFQLPPSAAITGKFEGRESQLAGADAGLRDRNEIGTVSHLIQRQSALEEARALEAARLAEQQQQRRHGGARARVLPAASAAGGDSQHASASEGGPVETVGSVGGGGSEPLHRRANGKQRAVDEREQVHASGGSSGGGWTQVSLEPGGEIVE